jgi:NADH-quinone oxidoreductase subunit G
MIKEAESTCQSEEEPMRYSFYSGAGTIFGATGGVMEAAIRSAYTLVTGEELEAIDIQGVRGLDGVKEATIPVPGFGDLRVAVAHGLSNARKVMDAVREGLKTKGESPWHFIEIMACPGGCVGGGGQPYGNDIASEHGRPCPHEEDRNLPVRNLRPTEITRNLERFLGLEFSLAHKLLHTLDFKRLGIPASTEKATHKPH